MTKKKEVPQALQDGVEACRRDDWRVGWQILTGLAQKEEGKGAFPAYFYSYLGVAMARVEGRKREGVELCRYAVHRMPRDPQNRLNLATVYLIDHRRSAAVKQIEAGLGLRPYDKPLLALQKEIGARRPPPIRFLARGNVLNIWIGRLTWRMKEDRETRAEVRRETEEFERLASRD